LLQEARLLQQGIVASGPAARTALTVGAGRDPTCVQIATGQPVFRVPNPTAQPVLRVPSPT